MTITKAFETYDDLAVSVGKMGGALDYGDSLLSELRELPAMAKRPLVGIDRR